jgi:hypothetical protein
MTFQNQWCVIVICGHTAGQIITDVLGPFTKVEAIKLSDQYNEEHGEHSLWHTIVRPLGCTQ